jgi:membrane protease YdiL (CAAX protease family)
MSTTSSETSSRLSEPKVARARIAWLVMAGIFVALAFGAAAAGEVDEDAQPLYDYQLGVGSLVVYAIIIGLTVLIAARNFSGVRRALGLVSFRSRWIWIVLGLSFLALVLSGLLEPLLHAGEEQGVSTDEWRPEEAKAFALNAFVIVTVVPLAEELFFRGLGVRVLAPLGAWWAVLGTAVVFGLSHGILVALPPLVIFGLVLGYVRLRSDSIWPGVIAHAFYNGVAIAAPLLVSDRMI